MAISVVNANRGTNNEKTSDTSLTLTPSGNLSSGNYAVLAVVWDAMAAETGQTTRLSVTDNGPNVTWTRLREQTQGGGALDGVTCALFLSDKLTSNLTTSNTISIASTANGTAKACGLAELSVNLDSTLVLSTSGSNGSQAAASTSYSVALSGLTSAPGIYIGLSAAEDELAATVTMDASYTALFGGSISSGTGGANATNVIAQSGYLANTSTGDTYNASSLTSADRATILVRLEERYALNSASTSYAITGAAADLVIPPVIPQIAMARFRS